MKKFEFQNNDITIEMLGHTLQCDAAEIECSLSKAHKDLVEFGVRTQRGETNKKEIEELLAGSCTKIDEAFGAGTAEKIFAGRRVSYHDMCDVVTYIIAACNEFEHGKKSLYDSYNGNREERRAGLNPVK